MSVRGSRSCMSFACFFLLYILESPFGFKYLNILCIDLTHVFGPVIRYVLKLVLVSMASREAHWFDDIKFTEKECYTLSKNRYFYVQTKISRFDIDWKLVTDKWTIKVENLVYDTTCRLYWISKYITIIYKITQSIYKSKFVFL